MITPYISRSRSCGRLSARPTLQVQADESDLYWMDGGERAGIYHVDMTKGSSVERLADPGESGGSLISQFAIDACNLYWLAVDPDGAARIMAIAR